MKLLCFLIAAYFRKFCEILIINILSNFQTDFSVAQVITKLEHLSYPLICLKVRTYNQWFGRFNRQILQIHNLGLNLTNLFLNEINLILSCFAGISIDNFSTFLEYRSSSSTQNFIKFIYKLLLLLYCLEVLLYPNPYKNW